MCIRTLHSLLFFTVFSVFVYAQVPLDVSGKWVGTSTFLNGNYQISIEISQKENQLSGYTISRSMTEGDSIKTRVNGLIDDDKVTLYPAEVIYKTGIFCATIWNLEAKASSQYKMEGRWKGDMSLKTCPPGVSGSLKLYKVRKQVVQEMIDAPGAGQVVAAKDDIGEALVKELEKRKYYALIIGVEAYEDKKIQTLENPIQDGERLASTLKDLYSFKEEDMTILQNPKREEIIETLDMLSRKVTAKDNVLIFYAGHGIWNEQLNQGYWLPSDASTQSKSYWISNSTIRDYIGGIRSKHTLLISDACFSGGILKERAVFSDSRAILELYKLPSRKAMTSGTLKTVPDKSVFIEYLIKSLESNDAPLLSADQLFRNFKIAVINNSPNRQVPQYGPIIQAGDEGGDFIFLRKNNLD